jgi:myo-inositol-1-phosphate synthase
MEALASNQFRTAAPYYFAAALLEGAAIADYTASATLEIPGLIALAQEQRCPVAGRDGSTGQTLLKSVLAETFATRRLRVRGWYSTNILGNHDGLVLQDERYADVKRYDKTALLEQILGYPIASHLVDVRHYLPAGDEKEAWDAIDFEAWYGGRGQLRLDWRCSDSLLATPPILDLIRFLAHAKRTGVSGLLPAMGVFFKPPLGTSERRYLHLFRALSEYCRASAASAD